MMTFEGSAGRGKYTVASPPSHQNLSFGRTMTSYFLQRVACGSACVCVPYHIQYIIYTPMYSVTKYTWQSAVASAAEVVKKRRAVYDLQSLQREGGHWVACGCFETLLSNCKWSQNGLCICLCDSWHSKSACMHSPVFPYTLSSFRILCLVWWSIVASILICPVAVLFILYMVWADCVPRNSLARFLASWSDAPVFWCLVCGGTWFGIVENNVDVRVVQKKAL